MPKKSEEKNDLETVNLQLTDEGFDHEKNSKALLHNIIAVSIVIFIVCSIIVFALLNQEQSESIQEDSDVIACTADAKICPDGSSVGRTGPDCSFAECPAIEEISNVRKHTGEEFSFQYDERIFQLFPVTTKLPHNYEMEFEGVKLIATSRSSLIGTKECIHGQTQIKSTCTLELEGGIEFTHVDDSVFRLIGNNIGSLATTTEFNETKVISINMGAEGEGIDYFFVPTSASSTLVVARNYRIPLPGSLGDVFPDVNLFNRIVDSLVVY